MRAFGTISVSIAHFGLGGSAGSGESRPAQSASDGICSCGRRRSIFSITPISRWRIPSFSRATVPATARRRGRSPSRPRVRGSFSSLKLLFYSRVCRGHGNRGGARRPIQSRPGIRGTAAVLAHRVTATSASCFAHPCHRAVAKTSPEWFYRLSQSATIHVAFAP
jgi:hypothetical protein